MFTQRPSANGWSPAYGSLGGGRTLRKWGPVEGSWTTWRHSLKGDGRIPVLPVSLLHHEVSHSSFLLCVSSSMVYWTTTGQSLRDENIDWNLYNCELKSTFPHYMLFVPVIESDKELMRCLSLSKTNLVDSTELKELELLHRKTSHEKLEDLLIQGLWCCRVQSLEPSGWHPT